MVIRGVIALLGVLLFLTGAVFIGQGADLIHGSAMSGHGGYAGLGVVLLLVGLALLLWAWRIRVARNIQ